MTSVTCISFSNSWDCGKLILVKRVWPCRCSVLAEQQQIPHPPSPFPRGSRHWWHSQVSVTPLPNWDIGSNFNWTTKCFVSGGRRSLPAVYHKISFVCHEINQTTGAKYNQEQTATKAASQRQTKSEAETLNKQTVHTPLFLCLYSIAVGSSDLTWAVGWGTAFH